MQKIGQEKEKEEGRKGEGRKWRIQEKHVRTNYNSCFAYYCVLKFYDRIRKH